MGKIAGGDRATGDGGVVGVGTGRTDRDDGDRDRHPPLRQPRDSRGPGARRLGTAGICRRRRSRQSAGSLPPGAADNPIGWLMLATAFLFGLSAFGQQYGVYTLATHPGLPGGEFALWIAGRFTAALDITVFLALLLFPDGHLPSPVAWVARHGCGRDVVSRADRFRPSRGASS